MDKFRSFRGLKGFGYYEVSDSFQLIANHDVDFFQKEILEQRTWMGNRIENLFEAAGVSAFDSGVICARQEDFVVEGGCITSLKCFVAPYQMMNVTIGELSRKIENEEVKPKNSTAKRLKADDDVAVAIGMVLSIVATKGSVERGNRTPYIVLIRRQNANIRKDQLDTAVVEGLNYGDFFEKDGTFTADLTCIAKRALEEERGLNCDMLEDRGILHMPTQYYLGYDENYHQWNFFGTVVVDCSIEEIVREGYYFTKDKFESKGIICLPIDPNVLFHFLSYAEIPIVDRSGRTHLEETKMWNTGWASILFAVRDFKDNKQLCDKWFINLASGLEKCRISAKGCLDSIAKKVNLHRVKDWIEENLLFSRYICLRFRNAPILRIIWFPVRKILNFITTAISSQEDLVNILCAGISILLLLRTVQYNTNQQYGDVVTNLSTLIAFVTCWNVVISTRGKLVNRRDLIRMSTYWESGSSDNLLIPEISVFRHISLIDGNVSEKERQVFFAYKDDPDVAEGFVSVRRKCQVFSDSRSNGKRIWTLNKTSNPRDIVEDFCWIFVGNDRCTNSVRFVVPCIIDKRSIAFKQHDGNKLKHLVDFEIEYRAFCGKNNEEIRQLIADNMYQYSADHFVGITPQVHFRFVLQANDEMIIIGFVNECENEDNAVIYQLTHSLSNTTFSERMLDDVTRVACEYAVTEYMGYEMSGR